MRTEIPEAPAAESTEEHKLRQRTERQAEEAPFPNTEDPLACLLSVTQELNATDDLSSGLERFAEALAEYVPYDTLGVLLFDELGRELRFELAIGYPPEVAEHWRFGPGQGLVGTAASTGNALRVDDVGSDPRFLDAGEKAGSELAVPLRTKGNTIGVLDLTSGKKGFFTEKHEQLLSFLGRFLASAIDNARLYKNTREQARTLSLLHELSRELASILDRRELLEKVAERIHRLVDHDLFSVLLWDEGKQLLMPALAVHADGREIGWTEGVPLGEGICGTAASLQQSLLVPNTQVDPRFVACSPAVDVRSELAVPLVFEGQLLGVINLESTETNAFSSRHEELLSTLAASLAIALENARLYEKAREDEETLAQDLAMAREIQHQLLPKSSPWIPGLQVGVGYRPARQLGGDFYDYITYPEGRVAFAVGDVAGKGTAAALYGSLAIGMLREHSVHSACHPACVLESLSDKLRRLGIGNRFLALVFGLYDMETRTLSLGNSGLPHPHLLRDGTVREIEVEGLPLGLLEGHEYQEVSLTIEPGDVVVFASDGVEESLDPEGQELGRTRVRDGLIHRAEAPADEIARGLLDDAKRWAGPGDASDDRTVLVLKAEG